MFKNLSFILVAAVCIFASFSADNVKSAYAQEKTENKAISILTTKENDIYDLSSYVQVVEDASRGRDIYKAIEAYTSGRGKDLKEYYFNTEKNMGYWLFFRAKTTNSLRSNWVADFGTLMNGTIGISNLTLFYSTDNLDAYQMADGRYVKNKTHMFGQALNAVPVTLKFNDTKTFALYVEPMSGFPFKVAPRLIDATVYQQIEADQSFNRNIAMFAIMALLMFIAVTYSKRGGATYLMLSAYIASLAVGLGAADEIIPLGNNSDAVYFDIICIAQLLAALLFSGKCMAAYDSKPSSSRISITTSIVSLVLIVSFAGNLDYSLNLTSSMVLFKFAEPLVFAFIIWRYLFGKAVDLRSTDRFYFSAVWSLPLIQSVIPLFGVTLSGISFVALTLAHAGALCFYSFSLAKFKSVQFKKREAQRVMKSEAEDEIKRTREMISRSSGSDLAQREKDLLIDIKQRETQVLQEANEMSESRLKLMAMVSHEIRTPMTGIMGLINLLASTHLNDKQREYIDTMHQTGKALLQMLNDVLDLSKAESGKMELETISFNIRDVVKSVSMISEPNARNKRLELKSEIDPSIPPVLQGDPSRLRQIMMNIVNNAIKFTDSGFIKISVKTLSAKGGAYELLFSIEDTGIGIPDHMRDSLFKAYSQGESSVSRKYGGTGLGLYICHHLVSAMGGTIDFKRSDRGGTIFFFNIPFEAGVKQQSDENSANAPANVEASAADSQAEVNILVVDDHEANRNIIAALLRKNNWRIVEAGSAHGAIDEINKSNFDAVFMDLEMPDFNGLYATGLIRKIPDRVKAATPVIAMTAHNDKTVISQCIQAGMNGYISKPVDIEKVEGIVKTLITRKRGASPVLPNTAAHVNDSAVKTDGNGQNVIQTGNASDDLSLDDDAELINDKTFATLLSIPRAQLNGMLSDLYSSLDSQIAALMKAIKDRDVSAVQAQAHGIAGVAANYGFEALSTTARVIEKQAKNSVEIDIISKYVEKIGGLYNKTRAEVSNKLA